MEEPIKELPKKLTLTLKSKDISKIYQIPNNIKIIQVNTTGGTIKYELSDIHGNSNSYYIENSEDIPVSKPIFIKFINESKDEITLTAISI